MELLQLCSIYKRQITVAAALKELPWRNVDPQPAIVKAITFLASITTGSSAFMLGFQ